MKAYLLVQNEQDYCFTVTELGHRVVLYALTSTENKGSLRLNLRMLEAGKTASGIFYSLIIGILRISNVEMVIKEFRGNMLRI